MEARPITFPAEKELLGVPGVDASVLEKKITTSARTYAFFRP
jgi:hypothetical protein